MHSSRIQELLNAVRARYPKPAFAYYGNSSNEFHGAAFRIEGVPATFSVHTHEGDLPDGMYDVQIEGVPPGDYIYTQVVSLSEFLSLIDRMSQPSSEWPGVKRP